MIYSVYNKKLKDGLEIAVSRKRLVALTAKVAYQFAQLYITSLNNIRHLLGVDNAKLTVDNLNNVLKSKPHVWPIVFRNYLISVGQLAGLNEQNL
jgi:hypothetical protein